jgi:hypothetical protein
VIVLCEGPHDKTALEEFFLKMGMSSTVIKVWLLGGDIMDKQDVSVFAESSNVVALIDRDPKSGRIRERFVKNCEEFQIPTTRLRKYGELPAVRAPVGVGVVV